jgi:hypothetical protein
MEETPIQAGDRVTLRVGHPGIGEVMGVNVTTTTRAGRLSRLRQMAKVRWEGGGFLDVLTTNLRRLDPADSP